ncbi:MAG: RND transporter [Gemmatimonadota bacterium]|nr:MAG: RND transporter [Gemmatimonadota bacterium]
MSRLRVIAVSACALWALAGCSTAGPPPVRLDAPALGRHLAPSPDEAAPAWTEPKGDVTLRGALTHVLHNHPGLASDSWELRAREAEVLQAGVRSNPELSVEVENVAGSGPLSGLDGAETTLALSHVFELGGKRAGRREVALRERDLAAWDSEIRRVDALSEAAAAFVQVLAAQERLAVADTLVGVADDVLASVARRVKAGGVSPVEERRARVSLETARVDRDQAAQELRVARARLSAGWGGVAPAFARAVGDLETGLQGELPSIESLESRLTTNPEVARWAAELDRRQAVRDLAGAQGRPDLTIGGGVRHFQDTGDAALLVGIGIPLPLFQQTPGASRAAEHRLERGREERREAEVRVRLALSTAHAELVAARDEAHALQDRIRPEADAMLSESKEAYARGRLRLTDVLDAQRSAFELRGRYVNALARAHVAVIEIERLLGAPLFEPAFQPEDR